jgi:hypothetical protein
MGIEAENELERYLILRQECCFGLTRHELRVLAFNFMEKLGVIHRFCDLFFFAMTADNYNCVSDWLKTNYALKFCCRIINCLLMKE